MSYENRMNDVISRYKALKEEKVKLEERLKVCKEEMKSTYNVDSVEELSALKTKTDKRIQTLSEKIEPQLSHLEEVLGV